MTLGDLMNVDASRQEKASSCKVELVKIYHEVNSESIPDNLKIIFNGKNILNIYYVVFKFLVTSDTGKKHFVFLRTNPDFDLTNWENNIAQVYCDCEDFKYRSAYILEDRNSLFENDKTKLSLGPALTTPPKRTPSLLCKHAYAALNWFVSNYSNLMKVI